MVTIQADEQQVVARVPLDALREWLTRYEEATRYLASDGTNVAGRKEALRIRDSYGALITFDGMRDALAHCDDLLAALKAMVASYDGVRDALTSPVAIAKLAAADAAIAKAEGRL